LSSGRWGGPKRRRRVWPPREAGGRLPGHGCTACASASWNKAGTSREDHRAVTPRAHPEDLCLPCHRLSWNRYGSRSLPCRHPRHVHHPLGCHRQRIPDRVVFDKLIQILVFGCGYRRIADQTCSATTLRRRRDEWITLGLAERLRLAVLGA
jgi:hypothetical protein